MKKRPTRNKHARGRPLPGWGMEHDVVAVVSCDTRVLRDRTMKACSRAAKAFEVDDRELKHFEQREVPSFERWKHLALGPLLAQMSRLQEELAEVGSLYEIAMDESARTGLPPWAALKSWRERMDRQEAAAQAAERKPDDDKDAFYDELDAFFEGLGLDPDNLRDEDFEEEPPPPPRRAAAPPPRPKPGNLRDLYRALCRLLHPDAAGEMSDARRELWHQVQEAYDARDAARLDALLARVEQDEGLASRPRTIAELLDLKRHYERARQALRRVLREASRHPAWKFSQRDEKSRARLEAEMRREIEPMLRQAAEHVRRMRALIEPPPPGRKRARKPRNTFFGWGDDDLFA